MILSQIHEPYYHVLPPAMDSSRENANLEVSYFPEPVG